MRRAALWRRIDELRDRWDVLRHPFYERWSAGGLLPDELEIYANEYEHAVAAIATASERAAALAPPAFAAELDEHAREERAHVGLWRGFARAAEPPRAGPRWAGGPLTQTVACARAWAGDARRPLAEHLVTLYAIESAQPAIAETKLAGLVEHYGFGDGPATEYFRVHVARDEEHAALARTLLDSECGAACDTVLARRAEEAYRAYWALLDRLDGVTRPHRG